MEFVFLTHQKMKRSVSSSKSTTRGHANKQLARETFELEEKLNKVRIQMEKEMQIRSQLYKFNIVNFW